MRHKTLAPLGLLLATVGFSTAASAVLTVIGAPDTETVLGNQTWCDDEDTIVLMGPTVVPNGVTLTIEPGCIVRGQPRDLDYSAATPLLGAPGSLQIYQGGFLDAEGTPTDPIIFTTAAVDTNDDGVPDEVGGGNTRPRQWTLADGENNFLDDTPKTNPLAPLNTAGGANVSLWGGITVAGFAPTNLGNALGLGTGIGQVEGTTAQIYGGNDPNDDSGILRYLSVRHAGDEIGEGNELNGISLAGVGDGTTCDHIEIYANFDDGIEWFGGNAVCDHLLMAYVGDDSVDTDQGWTGSVQNVIVLSAFFNQNDGSAYGSASGDRGGEWDGDDLDEVPSNVNPAVFSDESICNLTIVGNGGDGQVNPAVSPASSNRGFTMRNGFQGRLANSIVVNTGSAAGVDITTGGVVEPCSGPNDGDGVCGASCASIDGDEVVSIISTTVSDVPAVNACGLAAFANGDTLFAGGANIETATEQLVNENPFWDPQGTLSNGRGKLVGTLATPIDPTPIAVANDGIDPTDAGCPDATATYRGATDGGALFTDGWTAMSVGGVLPLPEPSAASSLGGGVLVLWGLARRRTRRS